MAESLFSYLRFVRSHPFSIMALSNIVGDLCYLGFAFDAAGFVSIPKLGGALCAMLAHILLLAYGDDYAHAVAAEPGRLSAVFFLLRRWAQTLTGLLPNWALKVTQNKPVGLPFLMLSMNGVGFVVDSLLRLNRPNNLAMLDQIIMGVFISLGTAFFAAADYVSSQKQADFLTKLAPSTLGCASAANIALAALTLNPFIILSTLVFALSNLAGFFTRLNKAKDRPHATA